MLRNITKIGTKTAQNQGGSQKLPKIQKFLLHFFFKPWTLGKNKGTNATKYYQYENQNCRESGREWGEGRGGRGGSNTHLIIGQKSIIVHIICPNWGRNFLLGGQILVFLRLNSSIWGVRIGEIRANAPYDLHESPYICKKQRRYCQYFEPKIKKLRH